MYETGFPALLYFYTPTNVDSSEKFEALWYCQSIEMFFWLWECLNFQGILAKFETAINQARSLVENEYFYTISEWDNHISSQNDLKLYIVAAVSEVSIVQYLWLLEEGRFQRLYWQTVCRKKIIQRSVFCKQFLAPWPLPVKQIIELKSSRSKGEAISLCEGNAWSCFPTLVFSNNRLFLSSPWKHYLIFLPFPLKTYRAREL